MLAAETAYNIVSALPEKEKQRLYKMLNVSAEATTLQPSKAKKVKSNDPLPGFSQEELVERLMAGPMNVKKVRARRLKHN